MDDYDEEPNKPGPITPSERREYLNNAFMAEDACRWKDMVENITKIAESVESMTMDERNAFATAYKTYIGTKRTSWRTIVDIESKFDSINRKRDLCKEYKAKLEEEIKKECNDVIQIIDKHLEISTDVENQIFYLKMKGDYYRYLSEFDLDKPKDPVFERSRKAYVDGLILAKEHLPASHPLRLGLILNFSVFYHEILKEHNTACDMTKENVLLCEEDLLHSHHNVTNRSDSEIILQLLKDNLKVWSTDLEDQTCQ
ncbi:hypothetical protein ACF0H5_018943 [Mactra antiquata]